MKLRILISLLFIVATTFAAVHELDHIGQSDDSSCLVCHVNNNLASGDVINYTQDIEKFHFEKVLEINSVLSSHVKNHSNQNRAPPLTL